MLEHKSLPDSTSQRHATTIPGIKLSHHVCVYELKQLKPWFDVGSFMTFRSN